jgi:hypothetical protein
VLALLVGLASFAVSGASYTRNRPLGALGGIADEWFRLGTNLAIHGTLGVDREPIVYRPPGYPLFVAGVLHAYLDVPAAASPEAATPAFSARGADAVYISQCLLLAVASSIVFLWLALGVRVELAFLGGLLFGTNPYSVALTTFLHYDVLHLLFLVAGCLALELAFERPFRGAFVAAGAIWGLATLVRPVTLAFPPFALMICLVRSWPDRARAFRQAAVLSVTMAAVVAPWTARNYRVTGHLIPVNAQTWQATWGTTVAPLGAHPDRYKWYVIARDHYRPIYVSVVGEKFYYEAFTRANLALEEAFRREALRNIRSRPGVYLRNAAASFASLHVDMNAILLTAFRRLQAPGVVAQARWFWLDSPGNLERDREAKAFAALAGTLALLSAGALVYGWRRGARFLVVPGFVWLCLALMHAVTYMDLLYYYVKLPFLVVLPFSLLDRLPPRWGVGLGGALVAWSLALTAWTLFG